MIRDGFLVLVHVPPLVVAIAVDDCKITPIISARVKGTRASVDCSVAGCFYANLAVVGRRNANEANGSNADQSAASPISDVPREPHENAPVA
jgi:hypothetical protein